MYVRVPSPRVSSSLSGMGAACNTKAAFEAEQAARIAAGQEAGRLTAQLTQLTATRDAKKAELVRLQAQTANPQ